MYDVDAETETVGWRLVDVIYYTVSQKNCANLFLSELRQISTNFDNFEQKDGKEAIIMRGILIFHLT